MPQEIVEIDPVPLVWIRGDEETELPGELVWARGPRHHASGNVAGRLLPPD